MLGIRYIKFDPTQHAILFSDGIEQDFIEFNSGASATISLAEANGNLVV